MKNIATINTEFPTIDDYLTYHSGASLLDYDVAIFDPKFPYMDTVPFSTGGHCVSVRSSARVTESMKHWQTELRAALEAGKTIFILMCKREEENFATGTSSPRKGHTTYHTSTVDNYTALPKRIKLRNSKGKKMYAKQDCFKPLLKILDGIFGYDVLLEDKQVSEAVVAKDGSRLGGVFKLEEAPGHLVCLPYFSFEDMTITTETGEMWTDHAVQMSHAIVSQLLAIDRELRAEENSTPAPEWVADITPPQAVETLRNTVGDLETRIEALEAEKLDKLSQIEQLERYKVLLYGTGKALESVIADVLMLLGYKVEGFREGDLEIDHVIISPEGTRMIGEAEGKDNSAISITKFRQLESNINEDFARDDVTEPAQGILFGNGFRLTDPSLREGDFTEKCYTNAARLNTALVRTADFYPVALHILNKPNCDDYRAACRSAIEKTQGTVVVFPQPN